MIPKIIRNPLQETIDIALYLLIFIALIVFVGNTDNADFSNLQFRYLNGSLSTYAENPGIYLFVMMFRFVGFSYFWFHAFEAVCGILLLSRFLKRYSDSPASCFLLYMIYPFLLDIVQMDNFLAYVIVLNGLPYLEDNSWNGSKKYAATIIVAALFHAIALIYLMFLIVNVKKIKTIVVAVGLITGVLYFNIKILPSIVDFIPFFSSYSSQLSHYLAYKDEFQHGAILYIILCLVMFLVGAILYRVSILKKDIDKHEVFLLKLMAVTICLSVFIIIHGEFVRTVRNMWILFYCYFFIKKDDWLLTQIRRFFILAFAIFLFVHELGIGTYYYNNVTDPILTNNLFWKWLM